MFLFFIIQTLSLNYKIIQSIKIYISCRITVINIYDKYLSVESITYLGHISWKVQTSDKTSTQTVIYVLKIESLSAYSTHKQAVYETVLFQYPRQSTQKHTNSKLNDP